MTKAPKKQRLSVYLEPDVMKALSAHAARRGHSLSLVAEAGIASFLSPDAAERQEAAITKRLDQLDRRMTRMTRMERDVGISVETLAIFVRFWLTTTPALPEPAARPLARRLASRKVRLGSLSSPRERAEAQAGNRGGHRSRARRGLGHGA
jgi:predicted transcriptional regulator